MMEQALGTFIEEAREFLQQMEDILLDSITDGDVAIMDAETTNALFRAAHTIKGSAGLFGLDHVVGFTHVVESVLDQLRNGKLEYSAELVTTLLSCRDHIGTLITLVSEQRELTAEEAVVGEEHRAHLLRLLEQCDAPAAAAAQDPRSPAQPAPAGTDAGEAQSAAGHWHISLRLGRDILRGGLEPLALLRYLRTLGRIVHLETLPDALPSLEHYDPESCYLGFEIDLQSTASKEEIEAVFEFVRADSELHILPPNSRIGEFIHLIEGLPEDAQRLGDILVAGGTLTRRELETALAIQRRETADMQELARPLGQILVDAGMVQKPVVRAALEKQKKIEGGKRFDTQSIKVPADRLDDLIDLVGELVTAGSATQVLAQRAGAADVLESAAQAVRLVEAIRDGALRLRMVQVGEVFNRFPRVVHDVSRELGKEIELRISGADTELDKSMVERIADPLMHLVRNAMDHGIETAAVRSERGKPARGVLCLNAYHESGAIVIEVRDDGGGLDPERIVRKAIERGLVAPNQNLSRDEILQLILLPGFSTAEQITNLSGRGVGMDVVRSNVEALRGSIEIQSEPGKGTCMRLHLPLTLAIIDGFLVGVNGSSFVLPLDLVVECIELPPNVQSNYLDLRGHALPFVRLRELFDVTGEPPRRQNVVIINFAGQMAGIVVDCLLGECQTVIKPLGRLFEKVNGISGSSILGTGDVALILDVPHLVSAAITREARALQYKRTETRRAVV